MVCIFKHGTCVTRKWRTGFTGRDATELAPVIGDVPLEGGDNVSRTWQEDWHRVGLTPRSSSKRATLMGRSFLL